MTGQQGARGIQGVQGFQGIQGIPGEGHQGDTGQRGAQGERGAPGKAGGASLRLTDRRLLFLLVLAVGVFTFLTWRVTANAHRQDVHNWHTCERSRINTTKVNATDDAFVRFLTGVRPLVARPDQIDAFAHIYRDSKLVVPTCGPKP